jgi:hypothetical protein
VILAVLDEFLLTSVQVWEKKIRFKKSDKIVDTVTLTSVTHSWSRFSYSLLMIGEFICYLPTNNYFLKDQYFASENKIKFINDQG